MQIIRRVLILSSLALALSGGAAFADRWRGGGNAHGYARGSAVTHPSYTRTYAPRSSGYNYGYARRPIYMRAPVIRDHYYSYHRRPTLVVENYAAMDGYVWVRGQWSWNGYEWMWQPGHYEPTW